MASTARSVRYSLSVKEADKKRDQSGTLAPSRRPASACKSMALEVVKLYISLLSTFFTLSDISISESSRSKSQGEDMPVPSFVPPGTTVLSACHFGEKLVEDVNEGIGELMGVDIGSEAGNGLRNMLDSLKWRLQEVVTALWARGASTHLT